ncbi:hypothetical protein BBJ28_00008881 [Nothophytophthora sp. Chile5]|nr:hypothetical protein BBJ28_00008881 [Nothophytophthora sp. Chile5]
MLSTSPSMGSSYNSGNPVDRNDQTAAAQPFARLNLPVELQSSCQEMVELASSVYVKAFALSSALRAELLQVCPSVSWMKAIVVKLTSSQEAARLRFLIADNQRQSDIWLPIQLLTDVRSLDEFKRTFVAVVRKAWPIALAEAAAARVNGDCLRRRSQALARATITQPAASAKPEPREITANWPFEQRIRCSLTHIRDVTQVYIKSVLPNGDATYHHVPATCVRYRSPRQHVVDHTISLTVSPFSDPTAFKVVVCLGHPALPGGNEVRYPVCFALWKRIVC